MSSTGYHSESNKSLAIKVPKGSVWTTIAVIDDLAEGPTIINPQMYGTLPTVRPKDIEFQMIRDGAVGEDERTTAGGTLPIGSKAAWRFSGYSFLEFVDKDNLPFLLQLRQNGGGDMTVTTVIEKAHDPAAYIAARTSPDPND